MWLDLFKVYDSNRDQNHTIDKLKGSKAHSQIHNPLKTQCFSH